MKHKTIFLYLFSYIFIIVDCGYPPTGDEVQAGSVLLPATRRGRYLANIVRRQAVDGTGIKFNKDADRMNAEAKKKVDVLSEELLPYIIAEQERRTTLYKRIMTAIQNGEKGVTIAELRNKPPLIIRKGLMYRCPANRAPKEPDGSGIIMCEDEIEPTPVMYDSCLSAEDKELYVAENKYFFCNRHKVEGPDLPRNGSTVIGCAPIERTSLNYTTSKCALEDTDDVLVHYRYYPDRTYKFVTELDPDREVCEHWNPCQIGYIYSLPSPDQATMANELWHDYMERNDEYEKDEIIPSIPEDDPNEYVPLNKVYTTSRRKWLIPEGYYYDGTGIFQPNGVQHRLTSPDNTKIGNLEVTQEIKGHYVFVTLTFTPFKYENAASYYLRFKSKKNRQKFKFPKFLTLNVATTSIQPRSMELLPSQPLNSTSIPLRCNRCILKGVMLRAQDGTVANLDPSRYSLKGFTDSQGKQQKYIEIDLEGTKPQDFGDYFAIIQNEDGTEERVKALTIVSPELVLKAVRLKTSSNVGEHYDRRVTFNCEDCELVDVLCNGESVLTGGRITVVQGAKLISFNFPSFDDTNSCVYMGVFKKESTTYRKILAVFENDSPAVKINTPLVANSPQEGQPFEHEVTYSCDDCTVDKVSVNGILLEMSSGRRSNAAGSYAFYVMSQSSIIIRINEFSTAYEGVYQAVFSTSGGNITKTILEIKDASQKEEETPSDDAGAETTASVPLETTSEAAGVSTSTAGDTTTPEPATTPAPGN